MDFKFVISEEATPGVKTFLRGGSEKEGEPMDQGTYDEAVAATGAIPGDGIEFCPMAHVMVEDVAARIAQHGGGALFFDYGENHALEDSLRGFHRHDKMHVLSRPGEVDITADVDFASLVKTVNRMDGVRAFGPVEQGTFLMSMGLGERLEKLAEAEGITEKEVDDLVESAERLVDPEQMGRRFKVIGLQSGSIAEAPPGGFQP